MKHNAFFVLGVGSPLLCDLHPINHWRHCMLWIGSDPCMMHPSPDLSLPGWGRPGHVTVTIFEVRLACLSGSVLARPAGSHLAKKLTSPIGH